MSTEAWVIILGTAPVFALGWFSRGLYETLKETRMASPTQRPRRHALENLFVWFSHGHRLVGLVLFCAVLAVSGLVYTFTADQQSEGRSEDLVKCVGRYVRETSESQAPRTAASIAANDARRDWDQGFSKSPDARGLTRDELFVRYLSLYRQYELVRGDNPTLPAFSLEFCKAGQ